MVPVFPLVPDCWKKEESCLRYHSEAAFFLGKNTSGTLCTMSKRWLCMFSVCVVGQMVCLLSELQVDERLHCAGFDLYDQIDGEDKEYYLSPER